METNINCTEGTDLPMNSTQEIVSVVILQPKPVGRPRSVLLPVFLTIATCSLAYAMYGASRQPVIADQPLPAPKQMFAAAPTEEASPLPAFFETEIVEAQDEVTIERVTVALDEVEDSVVSGTTTEGVDAQISANQFQVLPIPAPPDMGPGLPFSTHAAGIYLTSTSVGRDEFFEDSVTGLSKAGGNAFVLDVKGSAVYFDAESQLAKDLGLLRKQYDLPEVIRAAHEKGIYVIGRFVAVKDAGLARAHPDALIAHPVNGRKIGQDFVDPENETVLAYNGDILCLLAQSGIDEINLDYIRFSTEQVGELRIFSSEEKARKVGAFVSMARETIDRCGPKTILGLSTYAILGWNYEINLATLGQDVVAWAPLVDIISPMAYPSTFAQGAYYDPAIHKNSRNHYLVWRTLEGYKELLGEHAWKLRPWIQGYGMTLKGMKDQMQAVSDAGLCGFTVWSAENIYGNTFKAMTDWKRGDDCD